MRRLIECWPHYRSEPPWRKVHCGARARFEGSAQSRVQTMRSEAQVRHRHRSKHQVALDRQ